MGTVNFIGKSLPVAQVQFVQVAGTYHSATVYTFTIGGVDIDIQGAGSDAATVDALADAVNASTHPYYTKITAVSDGGDKVTMTADNAGFPFEWTATYAGGTGEFGSITTVTVSSGPHHWDTLANFDTGSLPTTSDDVVLANGDVDIFFGLDTNTDVLDSYTQKLSWVGKIGLPKGSFSNGEGVDDDTVQEYRETYLHVRAALIKIGEKDLESLTIGSGRVKIKGTSTAACITHIYETAQVASESGMPAVRLVFNDTDSDLQIHGGRAGVGIGIDPPGESFSMGDILVHASAGRAQVSVGNGVAFQNWEQYTGIHILGGGTLAVKLTVHGGEVVTDEDLVIPTFEGNGGLSIINGVITAGTNNVGSRVDASQNAAERTWAAFISNVGSQLTASKFGAGGLIITAHTLPTKRATIAFT